MVIKQAFELVDKKHIPTHPANFIHLDLVYWGGMMFTFELAQDCFYIYVYKLCPAADFDGAYWCDPINYQEHSSSKTGIEHLKYRAKWLEYIDQWIDKLRKTNSAVAANVKTAVHIVHQRAESL